MDFAMNATSGEKYDPAMEITEQNEADVYFEKLVRHAMAHGKSRQEAEEIERHNLGYWAGYYSSEVRARVERLFACAHPFIGPIAANGPPTVNTAMNIGKALGENH